MVKITFKLASGAKFDMDVEGRFAAMTPSIRCAYAFAYDSGFDARYQNDSRDAERFNC